MQKLPLVTVAGIDTCLIDSGGAVRAAASLPILGDSTGVSRVTGS